MESSFLWSAPGLQKATYTERRLLLPDLLKQFVGLAKKEPKVQRVYVFGSRARGDQKEHSDLDLAVEDLSTKGAGWAKLQIAADEDISSLLPINLVSTEDCPQEIKQSILREGVVIYDRELEKDFDLREKHSSNPSLRG